MFEQQMWEQLNKQFVEGDLYNQDYDTLDKFYNHA